MSNNQNDLHENLHRKKSTSERRNSKLVEILKVQYSFYDIDNDVITSESNLSPRTNNEDDSECVYATMDSYDGNFKSEHFEINQSIKLLTNLDYLVPLFNTKLTPLYDYRDILTLNPLVTISSEIDANMYECLKMKEESMHAGGVEINVTKKELLHMRLFKLNEFFWIIKCPDQKNNRKLFHIGDKIISVDGKEIPKFNKFKEILAATDMINVLKIRIQRLPRAKIFGVKVENYKSIFHLDEQSQFIVLNNLKDDDNNKWLITEIDGENIDYICNQIKLESFLEKPHGQYVTIVLQPKDLIKKFFNHGFS